MKSLIANVLFFSGDKLSRLPYSWSADLYVWCMSRSDELKPWPSVKEKQNKNTGSC